jgi:hypothetical protein
MSSKLTRVESADPMTASSQAETREVSVGNVASDAEVRLRAYEIYLQRGETPGLDLDDWLQAERELQGGLLSRAPVA